MTADILREAAAKIRARDNSPFMLSVADLLERASRGKIHGFDPDDCPECRGVLTVARLALREP